MKQMSKVNNEDFGKTFEMAICLLYNTPFDGKYKYGLEKAEVLKERLVKLKDVFPYEIKHIAKNGCKYDFVTSCGIHLSAKTNKTAGLKVCPQVIGQPTKKKFCEFFGLGDSNVTQIKEYIVVNIVTLLDTYMLHTFECPIIYYNKSKNELLFVKLKEKINWTNITFTHILNNKTWEKGSTIKIGDISIGEFQIHGNRDCIKFRWIFKNILNLFKDHFEVTVL
jgi:hypothetical protein